MLGKLYWAGLRRAVRVTFPLWQWLGVHVTLNHFHEPVPDTRTLKDDLWARPSALAGVDINEKGQFELLSAVVDGFRDEYEQFPRQGSAAAGGYYVENGSFMSVDGEMLYGIVRHFKPRRIIEIGAGYSTRLAAQAILKNREEQASSACELVTIDPQPPELVRAGFPGLTRVIGRRVQDVPLAEFEALAENDILFIDSSHVLNIGSDVQYEVLEILPRLRRGVLVHVHDIFLPAEYPRQWALREHWFWNEQYVLQAFFAFNHSFEVLWAGSYMHLTHPEALEKAFSSYRRETVWPVSFWARRQ